jgi:3-oxoacyl-[acyl-carrier protein] reductase
MRLEGKTALVTGGASGFGAGIAAKFIAEGSRVMIADRDAAGLEATAVEIGAERVVADVGTDAGVAGMAAAALAAFEHLDVLVNNAGVTHLPAAMEDIAEAEFDRVLGVNAKSVYLTARHLVPAMKARGRGVILNIASTAALSPRPRLVWYNASKGWMVTATKAWRWNSPPSGCGSTPSARWPARRRC